MTALFLTLGAQLIFGGGALKYFLWYLRTVQIVAHLPMLKPVMPANVGQFFNLMIPLLTFDILDADWTTKLVFNFDYTWHEVEAEKYI